MNGIFPLVYLVAGTGCMSNAHEATMKICVILSPQPDAQIQTSLNLCDLSLGQNYVAATMIFSLTGMSQKGNCRCKLSPQHVAVACHLDCVSRP